MEMRIQKKIVGFVCAIAAATASPVMAAGMQPETSVVILYEADGEASINVKNTDDAASLLHSSIENVPEDTEELVVLTPPVARVEAGETQLVRFLRQGGEPSKKQRLKRVIFEGIPQRPNADGSARIGVTVRQNLPLIIHPAGLERNREPWKLLKWQVNNDKLSVINDSAYVVRMAQEVVLQPSGKVVSLPRTYVLPGETLAVDGPAVAGSTNVRIAPATIYGFSTDHYDAAINTDRR
ncbi:Capsule protein fraction 1 [Achromobacter xylosoxidans]|uniref:fimbria/pilus chaperone family protein n=2 Tax=Alcaligenes xylosoxydans xylosoxydans TaxID=85698 RepID=UPI0006C22D9F|nr:fimbria/pilus chaperone family protein [Achromobacter xylosoxidans]MCH1992716.1 fimbria/pilus periplasmic chaperone [Achromobacter xylosoxidans]CUI39045.1 Capsule protein fraction 1 [Achromobacter xylosoxidans]CUI59330.1 Capsule protein fraction 1 [Achromobacter xylosoxidans]